MIRLASVAVGAVLLFGCSSAKLAPTSIEASSDLRDSQDDILDRRLVVNAEIRELGPDHPWAGTYYAGDGTGINVTLTLAPKSGCVATWYGCMGLYGANYGRVTKEGNKLHIEFEGPNTPGEFSNFETDYVIRGSGDDVRLVPPESSVLLVLSPGGLSRD